MNQLKQIFGLPATISHTARSSSLSRSAGSNGRDSVRTRQILAGTRTADHSPELRLSGKSYARLIADYSNAIDARNARSKCNSDLTGRGLNIGFFSKTPFERLARVSSFIKVKNGVNSNGANLSTTNTSGPPITTTKMINGDGKSHGSFDETEILEQVTERAQWLDRVVEAHRAKRSANNNGSPNNYERDKMHHVHPLVQKAVHTVAKGNVEEFHTAENMSDTMNLLQKSNVARNKFSTTNMKDKEDHAKNISVTVKSREDSDAIEDDVNAVDIGDNTAFLVTVTEESNLSSNTKSSPLRHIDLRINGKPAIDMDTVIKKVEKLDVVSLADKIEIKIPVLADTRGNIAGESRASNSTINLCISSHVKRTLESSDDGGTVKVRNSRDAGSGNSRPSSAHPSTFYVTKINNARKASRCKVVPWWTTEESFRRSEIVSARSSESPSAFKEAKAPTITEVAARGNNQKPEERDVKKFAISEAKMKIKTAVTKPSSPRQRMRTRRRAPTAISRIIENELRKKSEESQANVQRYVRPVAKKSVAKHEAEVKTATNEPKKGMTLAIIDETIEVKDDRSIMPTLDRISTKIPTTISTRENGKPSGPNSVNGPETSRKSNDGTNDDSNRKNSNESSLALPINIVTNDNKTDIDGCPLKKSQAPKAEESVLSESSQKFDPEAEIKGSSRPLKTHGDTKRLSDGQTIPESGNRSNATHNQSMREIDEMANNSDEKIINVKRSPIVIKPIEKKKDGTLIDYGLTVSTRKKSERKLLDSRSTAGANSKKFLKKEEPPIVATIKEVIPRRDKEFRGGSINRGIVYPAQLKQNGATKNEQNQQHAANRKHHPCWSKKTTQKLKTDNTKNSKIIKTPKKTEKNPLNSSESKNIEDESPEKKLLYSAWLRRVQDRDGNDPDSSKDPRNS